MRHCRSVRDRLEYSYFLLVPEEVAPLTQSAGVCVHDYVLVCVFTSPDMSGARGIRGHREE